MPIYNLLQYNKTYSKTTGSLWNCYRDELSDNTNDNNNPNKNVINSESFNYKAGIPGSTYSVNAKITNAEDNEVNNPAYDANKSGKKEVEIVVPVKYLSNFRRALKIPLINCEVSLILPWCRDCVITSMEKRVITNTQRDTSPKNATFQIKDTKLYLPVVTLSTENDKILSEQLRTGLKITIKSNKYRTEMTNQAKNNNLTYLIDPTFTKVNRLFVLSFENEDHRTSFSEYYVPNIQTKDFNVLIDRKSFFDMPIKNEQIIEMGRNNDYTKGTLLDYE